MSTFALERLPHATAWRFGYLVSQGGMSLLLFVLLAHLLAVDQFAPTAIAQGVLVLAQALGDFGLSLAVVTALPARMTARPGDANDLAASAAVALLWASAAALALALLTAAVVPAAASAPVALIAPAASMAVLVSGSDGLLRAVGEFRRPAILVTMSRTGAFLGVIAAAATDSASLTCAAISLGTVLASLPATRVVLRRYRDGRATAVTEMLRAAVPLGVAQLFVLSAGRINTVLLSSISGAAAGAGFESCWRLYQLAQYFIGGLATAAAPFMARALGSGRHADLLGIIKRVGSAALVSGLSLGLGMYALRNPISHFLFGPLSHQVAHAITPLAIVTPLAFLGFLATMVLAASPPDHWAIIAANAFGALANLILLILLARGNGLSGGTLASAIGIAVAQVGLLLQFARLLQRLRRSARSATSSSRAPPTPLP